MRGCFDIGSGATKLMIIKYQNNEIIEVYSKLDEVLYGRDWKINGYLSDSIQEQGLNSIR